MEPMTLGTEPHVINVSPHPRLLSVLGDIEFAPWQCVAELVDNAFDEFLRQAAAGKWDPDGEAPTVWVSLPARSSGPRDSEVWVRDNGPGMMIDQLTSALRAGWSSNDRFGRLGLYGVGFNIATARLGYVAVVKTARAEDPTWTVVTLDLRELARSDHYDLPVTTEPKSPGDHGTTVVIRELKEEHHETLSRQQAKIRNILGDVYSHVLSERGFRLLIDRHPATPRLPCLWDESRYVVRNRERIPAVIKIDEQLPNRPVCLDCGTWQDGADTHCAACDSNRLRSEERRIWGWLGIQRYLHQSDYGIDFIRNGRKILLRDDSLFHWQDPDDPTGRGQREYPVEVPSNAGRIVGEIHIDHVKVNYQKNAFEYDTPEWKRVVRVLRGHGPILPKAARAAGYTVNTSPLARLVAGYRRNDPGLSYLIPGDGKNALHDRAREWVTRFRAGDAKYRTDEEWYHAAELHDRPPAPPNDPPPNGDGAEDDILRRKGLLDDDQDDGGQGANGGSGSPVPPPQPETEEQRRIRWREAGRRLPDLETKFGLPGYGAALDVTAYLVQGQRLRRAQNDERVPVYVAAGRGPSVEVFIDATHEVFTDFAVDTRDLVVMELAEYIRVRDRDSDRSLSSLFYDLKSHCLPDHKISGFGLNEVATRLLDRVREGMRPIIAGNSSGHWDLLTTDEQDRAVNRFALEGGTASWEDDVLPGGDWIEYVPGMALVRLVSSRPGLFLDGRVFRSAHESLGTAEARLVSSERVVDLLGDVAVLADRPTMKRDSEELQRGRLSCILLERELSPVDAVASPS
jgi:Histidine kinase-, DNA gyrase B-, and HSP90-like ATPase